MTEEEQNMVNDLSDAIGDTIFLTEWSEDDRVLLELHLALAALD